MSATVRFIAIYPDARPINWGRLEQSLTSLEECVLLLIGWSSWTMEKL